MIKKLDDVYAGIISKKDIILKINKLIDIVNALVEENNIHEKQIDELQMKEPVDKFAEQKKWIGKLCKFWDIDKDYYCYGILTKIHDISPYNYECNHRICYENCEPVSEDLIYNGE